VAIDGDDFEDHWATTMAINLTAYARFVRAALPDLRRERSALIIDVASTEGVGATAGISPYPATKHGMIGLTRSLAVELGPAGVTVNYVCPGPHQHRYDEIHPRRWAHDPQRQQLWLGNPAAGARR
jgi:3-oxoacyl-[acyl-carrier protein] reductase